MPLIPRQPQRNFSLQRTPKKQHSSRRNARHTHRAPGGARENGGGGRETRARTRRGRAAYVRCARGRRTVGRNGCPSSWTGDRGKAGGGGKTCMRACTPHQGDSRGSRHSLQSASRCDGTATVLSRGVGDDWVWGWEAKTPVHIIGESWNRERAVPVPNALLSASPPPLLMYPSFLSHPPARRRKALRRVHAIRRKEWRESSHQSKNTWVWKDSCSRTALPGPGTRNRRGGTDGEGQDGEGQDGMGQIAVFVRTFDDAWYR